MKPLPEIFFSTREEWRDWLLKNHDKSEGVWMIFHHKKSGLPTLTLDEFVEEALCFGWIDSTLKNIDDKSFRLSAMPRKNVMNWSDVNRKRVEKLIAECRMTESGLNKIGNYASTGVLEWPVNNNDTLIKAFTEKYLETLKLNSEAFNNFCKMSASHQKTYILWVMNAKQETTRLQRLEKAIELLKNNHKF